MPVPGDAASLDAQALAALHELDPQGHSGLVEQVLRAFDDMLQRLPGQAASALARGDAKGVGDVAHTLKSSSASVGASELHRCCVALERDARSGRVEGLESQVRALQAEALRVRAALAALPPARPPRA